MRRAGYVFLVACGKVAASGDGGTPDAIAPDASNDRECACVPPPPDGFFYIGYAEGDPLPLCPQGFASSNDLVEASGGPATCTCTCGALNWGGCQATGLEISYGTSCNALTTVPVQFGNGSCGTTNVSTSPGSTVYAKISVTQFGVAGECDATLTMATPPLQRISARACEPDKPYLGCAGGQSCLPKDHAPLAMCIEAYESTTPCPANFPNRRELGLQVVDGRQCTTCACDVVQGGTCTATFAPVWSDASCSTLTANLDGTCQSVGATQLDIQSVSTNAYTKLDNAVCGVRYGGSFPEGDVTLAGRVAICCTP